MKPFASKEEFQATVKTVKKFKEGIGRELHQKLQQRAKIKRNWVNNCPLLDLKFASELNGYYNSQLEEWWLDAAYLELRMPSQLYVNFGGPAPYLEHCWPPADGVELHRASISIWYTLQYWDMIRK